METNSDITTIRLSTQALEQRRKKGHHSRKIIASGEPAENGVFTHSELSAMHTKGTPENTPSDSGAVSKEPEGKSPRENIVVGKVNFRFISHPVQLLFMTSYT